MSIEIINDSLLMNSNDVKHRVDVIINVELILLY